MKDMTVLLYCTKQRRSNTVAKLELKDENAYVYIHVLNANAMLR